MLTHPKFSSFLNELGSFLKFLTSEIRAFGSKNARVPSCSPAATKPEEYPDFSPNWSHAMQLKGADVGTTTKGSNTHKNSNSVKTPNLRMKHNGGDEGQWSGRKTGDETKHRADFVMKKMERKVRRNGLGFVRS